MAHKEHFFALNLTYKILCANLCDRLNKPAFFYISLKLLLIQLACIEVLKVCIVKLMVSIFEIIINARR